NTSCPRRKNMLGVIFAIIGGFFMSIQSAFNTRVGESVGTIEATLVVHVVGLVAAIGAVMLIGTGSLMKVTELNKLYLIGGAFGVIIVYSVIKSISALGVAQAVMVIVVSQLLFAYIIDLLGLFGMEKVPFSITKIAGLIIIMLGIFVFSRK
ncbi:MAG: DMT family transporter, partial [Clostridiales bacterium]|nr:DMT family transporter [Clostridiales bacterium]